jgi:hypothetical protein
MVEIEKRVTLMIGEYTMNEYKACKALVKHKRRINRVFTEVCGDKLKDWMATREGGSE